MTDRFAELTAGTDVMDTMNGELYDIDINDSDEIDDGLTVQEREELKKFEKEADAISQAIDKIHENIGSIETKYKVSLGPHVTSLEKTEAANDISRIISNTEKTSDAIRKRLQRIAGENKLFAEENPNSTGQLRVRINTHQGMTRRFMETMQVFEETQEKHRDNVRCALERQLRIINPDAEERDIQEALRQGATDSVVEHSPVLMQLPPEEQLRLRNGLADLKSRNNDIKKLEQSIIQLHQLFSDMQLLVHAQGELLNSIEHNIGETKGKTKEGLEELVTARGHQKSASKKKICIGVLIIAVILAILIPVLIKFIPIWFPSTQETIATITGGNQTSSAVVYYEGGVGELQMAHKIAMSGESAALKVLIKDDEQATKRELERSEEVDSARRYEKSATKMKIYIFFVIVFVLFVMAIAVWKDKPRNRVAALADALRTGHSQCGRYCARSHTVSSRLALRP